MKKCFIMTAVLFSFSALLKAETQAFSDSDFVKSLSAVKTSVSEIKEDKTPIKDTIKFERTGKYVSLQGYLSLNGNVWVPQNGGFVSTYVNGWLQLRSSDGYYTDNQYVNVNVSFWVNTNQYVSQFVYPNLYVTVYDKTGKAVGSASTNGSINVSGWATTSFMTLNGSGYLNASIYVYEEEPAPASK